MLASLGQTESDYGPLAQFLLPVDRLRQAAGINPQWRNKGGVSGIGRASMKREAGGGAAGEQGVCTSPGALVL